MNNLTNTQGNTGLDLMQGFMGAMTGFENIGQEDLSLGKIKLLQATSQEVNERKGLAGQFYNSQTGESKDEIICYFLKVSKPRSAFERPYVKGSKPKCRSIDGKCGITASGAKRSCANCPDANWDTAKANGKTKPDCTESYAWLGALVDDNTPFRFTCSGDNVKITRQFINTLIHKRVAMFCHVVKLTAEQVSNNKGTYYVVKYSLVESYDPKVLQSLSVEQQQDLAQVWSERQGMAESLSEFFDKAIDNDTNVIDAEMVVDEQHIVEPQTATNTLF